MTGEDDFRVALCAERVAGTSIYVDAVLEAGRLTVKGQDLGDAPRAMLGFDLPDDARHYVEEIIQLYKDRDVLIDKL